MQNKTITCNPTLLNKCMNVYYLKIIVGVDKTIVNYDTHIDNAKAYLVYLVAF